jgi:flap endonuclease-1
MGIKGLKNIIKKHAPNAFQQITITDLYGKRIAIDTSILLYKFRYLYNDDYLIGFNNTINQFAKNNVNIVFVFDGKPPDAKRETLQKRAETRNKAIQKIDDLITNFQQTHSGANQMEYIDDSVESVNTTVNELEELEELIAKKNVYIVTKEHSNAVRQMLNSKGIQYFEPECEGEEYCSFLQRTGVVDYVLTEDTDSLTFGATKVLFNNNVFNKYLLCNLEILLNDLQMSFEEFTDFCILCGCDYIPSIPKVGPVTALKIIKKYKNIDSFIKENETLKKFSIPENFNYSLARELFTRNKEYQIPEITEFGNIGNTFTNIGNIKNIPLFIN